MHHGGHFVAQRLDGRAVLYAAMHQHRHLVLALVILDGEGGNVTRAQRLDLLGGPFDVLRPDVAAVMQDQVLCATGDHDLAVQPVTHVAGVEEAVLANHRGSRLVIVIVAGHQARRVDEDAADSARTQHVAARVADLDGAAVHRATAYHEAAGICATGRNGPALMLKGLAVD